MILYRLHHDEDALHNMTDKLCNLLLASLLEFIPLARAGLRQTKTVTLLVGQIILSLQLSFLACLCVYLFRSISSQRMVPRLQVLVSNSEGKLKIQRAYNLKGRAWSIWKLVTFHSTSSVHKSDHLLHAVTFNLFYMILYRLECNELCRRENLAAFHNPTGDKLGNTRVTIYQSVSISSRFVLQIRFLSSPFVYASLSFHFFTMNGEGNLEILGVDNLKSIWNLLLARDGLQTN